MHWRYGIACHRMGRWLEHLQLQHPGGWALSVLGFHGSTQTWGLSPSCHVGLEPTPLSFSHSHPTAGERVHESSITPSDSHRHTHTQTHDITQTQLPHPPPPPSTPTRPRLHEIGRAHV